MFRAAFSETPNYCRIIRLSKSNFKLESKFSRIQLRQPSQQSCAYFKINRIDELSSTFALGLTHNNLEYHSHMRTSEYRSTELVSIAFVRRFS